jgi:TBC1 domain family protein 5
MMQANAEKKIVFNPLAPQTNNDPQMNAERDMKDIIKQDVIRTNQEFAYFKRQTTKDLLTSLLFLWGKTYPEFGYRQGMNEILAIVLLVFDTERLDPDPSLNWDEMDDSEIANSYLI